MSPSDVTVTLTEAAERLGKSRKTVFRWVKAGKFPNAAKLQGAQGEEWRIPTRDIEELQAGTPRTQEDAQRDTLIELGKTQAQRDTLAVTVENLEAQLEQAHRDLEHERSTLHRLEVDAAKTEGERDALIARVDDLKAETGRLSTDLSETREAATREKESADELILDLTGRTDQLQAQLAEAQSQARWRYRRRNKS